MKLPNFLNRLMGRPRPKQGPRPRRPSRPGLGLEALEDRTVPAAVLSLSNGLLSYTGDGNASAMAMSYDSLTNSYTFTDYWGDTINFGGGISGTGGGTSSVS